MDADGLPLRRILTELNSVNYWHIFLIIIFILLGAFFAMCETAFSSCNKNRIRSKAEDGDSKAQKVVFILDNFNKSIISILIYTNIAHILCSSLATIFAIALLGEIGSVVSTVIITLLVFIFSETLPKNIANVRADLLVYKLATPLKLLTYLIYPLVMLFSLLYKAFSKNFKEDEESEYNEEDLSTIVDSIEDEGVLDEDESNLIQNAIDFDDTTTKEVFTPIKDVVSINYDLEREDFIKRILNESKFSRLPVYKDKKENIIGIVNVRMALKELLNNKKVNKDDLISRPFFVRQSEKLDDLLDNLMRNRVHIGIVRDNKNNNIGIITMDDILDELVSSED